MLLIFAIGGVLIGPPLRKARIAAASVRQSLPARAGGMPIRRAPVRFIAVARSALP